MNLSANSGNCDKPTLAVNGGNAYIMWEDGTTGASDVYMRRSSDAGATFLPVQNLSDGNEGESKEPSVAVDASTGNVYVVWHDHSTPTPPPAPSADAATTTLSPVADAYVKSGDATDNYGTDSSLRVRASSTINSYLQFNVQNLTGNVSSAKLRLKATDGSANGGQVFQVGNSWTERGITFNNAPPITGTALASLGAVSAGSTVEIDVTRAVAGNGTYSFALTTPSSDGSAYSSKEGATQPQLVITTGGSPPPPAADFVGTPPADRRPSTSASPSGPPGRSPTSGTSATEPPRPSPTRPTGTPLPAPTPSR